MMDIKYKGQKGKFFTDEEYDSLCAKIIANDNLINELIKEIGLNGQTIPTNR